ncbi:trypsin-like peptidase domain-containing protein [Tissierella sp. MB52-C2]|uniref:serine protease HtrA n=1 Tax=Tissierella sp. MB52-C2 TaxID=3070999 RepID=UPI00280B6D57|nr:trypsin-like peptidase domain-containing protein [Tissierella sp. MB52-C2]WMM24759.1 trypsin-like peptidase domain-containing protein [Tissierella sp. MB52-C2]
MDDYNYYSYNRPPKKNRVFSYILVALIAAIIGGIFGSYIAPTYLYGKLLPVPELYQRQETSPINQITITPTEGITPVTAAAKKAIGSVVGITTVQEMRELFWSRDVEGVGSGVIIDSNGYILTNSHVIGDGKAKSISVLIENRDKIQGKVLWYDSSLDLAIVKVEAKDLQVAELGDSDILDVGQLAVAIGNPLGLDFQRSVTSGVISGLHRSIRVDEYNIIEDLIQTDASINPGNSGGPLLNSEGAVIGINTAKVKTGEGLGFAIPINLIKPIAEQVIKEGKFSSVYIGFQGTEVERFEREFGTKLGINSGVVIIEILQNSPAEKANLEVLDIITKIDNQKVENMTQLRKILYKYKIGDKTVLTINRNGQNMEVQIEFIKF